MENKLLSLIIPAYNSSEYILECLASARGLLDDRLEIIVINDGSRDNTAELVEKCISDDNRIRMITVMNGGVSNARNIGLDNAAGKFIMFLDADDYLVSDTLDLVKSYLEKDQYDFIAFSRMILERDGKKWHQKFPFEVEDNHEKKLINKLMHADSLFNECWGKVYRKSIIDNYNIRFQIDIPIGEDLMFVMEYYSHCLEATALNIPLVVYRQHGDSAMRRFSVEDRIRYSEYIYDFSKKYIPCDLHREASFYYFKVLTNLCREYSFSKINPEAIRFIYASNMTAEVLKNLDGIIIPFFRKHEYCFMRFRMIFISAIYYYIKSKL
ncbi:glycosyltransferase family 2 protein [Lachnospiraceae bacterium C1.1]|nr:glycosyltransferase family 2 protein [Lachnospiraceae bacterium C1.1]